jgi:predicted aspartyl protease
MGTFHVRVEIGDLQGRRFETVDTLVDTGATYLGVPAPLLDSLSVPRLQRRPFTLGDGRAVEYDVGAVLLRLDGQTLPVLCVFAEPNSPPVLGAVALETFGLAVDPIHRRLTRVPGLR